MLIAEKYQTLRKQEVKLVRLKYAESNAARWNTRKLIYKPFPECQNGAGCFLLINGFPPVRHQLHHLCWRKLLDGYLMLTMFQR